MLPFVDYVAAPGLVATLIGLAIFRSHIAGLPDNGVFVCSPARPTLRLPKTALIGYCSLALLGILLWIGGRLAGEGVLHFFGMIVLVSTAVVTLGVAWTLKRRIAGATARLEIVTEINPQAVLTVGEQITRVVLEKGAVRAWTVGSGTGGPQFLQLAFGQDEASGFAMFVAPAMRHWAFAEGASWLSSYQGYAPVSGGPELLDLLESYVVPANEDWRPA